MKRRRRNPARIEQPTAVDLFAVDALVRRGLPIALDAMGLQDDAAAVRGWSPIRDVESAKDAHEDLFVAYKKLIRGHGPGLPRLAFLLLTSLNATQALQHGLIQAGEGCRLALSGMVSVREIAAAAPFDSMAKQLHSEIRQACQRSAPSRGRANPVPEFELPDLVFPWQTPVIDASLESWILGRRPAVASLRRFAWVWSQLLRFVYDQLDEAGLAQDDTPVWMSGVLSRIAKNGRVSKIDIADVEAFFADRARDFAPTLPGRAQAWNALMGVTIGATNMVQEFQYAREDGYFASLRYGNLRKDIRSVLDRFVESLTAAGYPADQAQGAVAQVVRRAGGLGE